jgi:methylphosphotriester-DNA--protein-cysteine methyltransferase
VTAASTELHGNVKSRVYHRSSCRNYTCQNCTRVFQSEAEAKAAGFRPAGDCH